MTTKRYDSQKEAESKRNERTDTYSVRFNKDSPEADALVELRAQHRTGEIKERLGQLLIELVEEKS